MKHYRQTEIIVGLFVLLGMASIGYLSLKLGEIGSFSNSGYHLTARFDDSGAIRRGADVLIAGVSIGKVEDVRLDNDEALLSLRINEGVKISVDANVAIRTSGIIGDRYVRISPGAEEEYLNDGDELEDTESAMNIEDLIAKYMFSGSDK